MSRCHCTHVLYRFWCEHKALWFRVARPPSGFAVYYISVSLLCLQSGLDSL